MTKMQLSRFLIALSMLGAADAQISTADEMLIRTISTFGNASANTCTNFYDTVCGNFKGKLIENEPEDWPGYRSLSWSTFSKTVEGTGEVGVNETAVTECVNKPIAEAKLKIELKEHLENESITEDTFSDKTQLAKALAHRPVFFEMATASGMAQIKHAIMYLIYPIEGKIFGSTSNYAGLDAATLKKGKTFIESLINHFEIKSVFDSQKSMTEIANEIWTVDSQVAICAQTAVEEEGVSSSYEGDEEAIKLVNEIIDLDAYLTHSIQELKSENETAYDKTIQRLGGEGQWLQNVKKNYFSIATASYFTCLKDKVLTLPKSSLRMFYLWAKMSDFSWMESAPNALFLEHKNVVRILGDAAPTSYNDRHEYCNEAVRGKLEESVLYEEPKAENDEKIAPIREKFGKMFLSLKKKLRDMVDSWYSQETSEKTDLLARVERLTIRWDWSFLTPWEIVGELNDDSYSSIITFDGYFQQIYQSGIYGASSDDFILYWMANSVVQQSIGAAHTIYSLYGVEDLKYALNYPVLFGKYQSTWNAFKQRYISENLEDGDLELNYMDSAFHVVNAAQLALKLSMQVSPTADTLFLQRFSLATCAKQSGPMKNEFVLMRPEISNFVIENLLKESNSECPIIPNGNVSGSKTYYGDKTYNSGAANYGLTPPTNGYKRCKSHLSQDK